MHIVVHRVTGLDSFWLSDDLGVAMVLSAFEFFYFYVMIVF